MFKGLRVRWGIILIVLFHPKTYSEWRGDVLDNYTYGGEVDGLYWWRLSYWTVVLFNKLEHLVA